MGKQDLETQGGGALIEIGDQVKEIGSGRLLTVVGYSSATKQFQVQLGNNSIPIRFVDEDRLELVTKRANHDQAWPGLIPEHWILR